MKQNRVLISTMFLASMAIIFTNCATGLTRNSGEPSFAKIERIHTKYFRIHSLRVDGLDSTVTVQGKIEHRSVFGQRAKGHIDISMISPTGEVVDKASVRPGIWRSTHRHRRRIRREAPFNITLNTSPITDSNIRMGFHKSDDSGQDKLFDCGNNMAVPAT